MGKTTALGDRELAWARARFATHYRSTPVPPPERYARREFAAFPFTQSSSMRRHLALRSVSDFEGFLRRETPRHVYYSAAYYRVPDAPTMNDKDWLGADLIFDLDADHLRNAGGRSYPDQLELVKDRLIDLVDDFLVGDFGLEARFMHLVFSGARGYHVHVLDPAYLGLTSTERREIVDYILGLGFNPASAVRSVQGSERDMGEAAFGTAEDGGSRRSRRVRPRAFQQLYPPDAPGWKGRVSRALLRLLARWETEGVDRAVRDMEAFGLTPAKARSLARTLVTRGYGKRIEEGLSLDVFRRDVPPELLDTVLRFASVELQGETDAPVTTDIHRLIRLPGSVHGGTGFRVVPLTREALERFDPFRDALVADGSGAAVSVELLETVEYPFEPPVRGEEGGRLELGEAAALFTILRGEAALRP